MAVSRAWSLTLHLLAQGTQVVHAGKAEGC